MSEGHSQHRVIQNGNPFEDARLRLAPHVIQTVIDVGANIGDVCRHLLANFHEAKIHAFEPDGNCFDKLAARFASEPRVTPVRLGLSDRPGRQTMFRYSESGLNALSALVPESTKFLSGYGVQSAGPQEVELTTLDEYCQEQNIRRVDFLKLDVQGWELHCLRGCQRLLSIGRIEAIYCEVNFVPLYEQQVYYEDVARILRDYGFRLFSLYALSFNEQGQLCWADALFLRVPGMPIVQKKRSLFSKLFGRRKSFQRSSP